MPCEWDERKRAINLAKHGVDFVDGCRIFQGPTVEVRDTRRDYGEPRFGAYGEVEGQVLFVVYTWRSHSRRLMSARKAGENERRAYYERIGRKEPH